MLVHDLKETNAKRNPEIRAHIEPDGALLHELGVDSGSEIDVPCRFRRTGEIVNVLRRRRLGILIVATLEKEDRLFRIRRKPVKGEVGALVYAVLQTADDPRRHR